MPSRSSYSMFRIEHLSSFLSSCDVATLAICTGTMLGEIRLLKWDRVDLRTFVISKAALSATVYP
jgi:hypothetical protein